MFNSIHANFVYPPTGEVSRNAEIQMEGQYQGEFVPVEIGDKPTNWIFAEPETPTPGDF